jgi:hypothetical protein
MSKKKPKRCDCIKQVDERLKEHNTRLVKQCMFDMEGMNATVELAIPTEKIDRKIRGRAKSVGGNYCPFFGSPAATASRAFLMAVRTALRTPRLRVVRSVR